MTSTPASVISSTASSPRSPLGIAWSTAIRGCGGGSVRRPQTVSSSSAGRAAATTHSATSPAPSVTSTRSPGTSRRTVLACLPSGPRSVTRSPASSAVAATKTGGFRTGPPGRQRPLKASRSREKKPCWPGANLPGGASSPRSLASWRSSSSCSGSSLVGVSTVTWMIRSPRPELFSRSVPCPYSGMAWPDCVPGRMSRSAGPSRVST